MGPYTHYRYAARYRSLYQPEDPGAFFFGAVAPDIRYLARLPRKHTHLDRAAARALYSRYPNQKSFIQGYELHCLLDEIDIAAVLGRAFPFSIVRRLRRKLPSNPQATILVELDALDGPPLSGQMCGGPNPILAELGLSNQLIEDFACAMQEYITAPSIQTAFSAFQRLNIVEGSRIEKYIGAYNAIQKRPLLRKLLLWGVRNARLEAHVDRHVQGAAKR